MWHPRSVRGLASFIIGILQLSQFMCMIIFTFSERSFLSTICNLHQSSTGKNNNNKSALLLTKCTNCVCLYYKVNLGLEMWKLTLRLRNIENKYFCWPLDELEYTGYKSGYSYTHRIYLLILILESCVVFTFMCPVWFVHDCF